MIIFRYLAKEIVSTMLAVTIILLLIFLCNQFVRYLGLAAAGKLPSLFVFRLMMLEVPNLLALLLPLGLFLGILLAYGRLYADNEMTALTTGGLSWGRFIGMTMTITVIVMLLVAFLVLWLGPKILTDREKLMTEGRNASIIDLITPGRFQVLSEGKKVVYIQSLTRDRKYAEDLFMADQKESGDDENSSWDILSAKSATIQENPETHERFVILKSGYRYQGTPGQKNYNVVKFSEYDLRIPEGKTSVRHEEKILPTDVLFPLNNKNLLYAAELQWRLALPISVLLLGFLAIPLSEIKPRQGKYASFLPAAVIYVIYANLLFVSRTWIVKGQISPLLGMWWLHASIFSLGLLLLFFPDIKRFFKRRG